MTGGGMVLPPKQLETDMNTEMRELTLTELDAVSGAETSIGAPVSLNAGTGFFERISDAILSNKLMANHP
jgi:hypothetical protein